MLETGVVQPDHCIFAMTAAQLGVSPSEVVFLDDAEPSVDAAHELGSHPVLHGRAAESVAAATAVMVEEERV